MATADAALHLAVRRHAEGFLASFPGLSRRLRRVLERFLSCGILGAGFVLVRCETCKDDFLVAWSCKDKSFCPSCAARRMTEIAAHWLDEVLPHVAWAVARGLVEVDDEGVMTLIRPEVADEEKQQELALLQATALRPRSGGTRKEEFPRRRRYHARSSGFDLDAGVRIAASGRGWSG